MSNYTKTVDFAAKDTLPSGDSGKIIKGTEFETEFDNISTAIATKADSAAPTFTGTSVFTNLDINGTVQADGAVTVGVDDTGYDVKFFGATAGKSLLWDESADSLIVTGTTTLVGTTNLDAVDVDGNMTFGDNNIAIFGAGSDLQIYHDGDTSYISHNTTGTDLVIQATSPGDDVIVRAADDLNFRVNGNENGIVVVGDGATSLYHANSQKIATSASGVSVTGTVTADDSSSADSTILTLANSYTTDAAGDSSEIMFQHYRSYSPSVTDSAFIKATKTQAWDATADRTSKLEFGTRNGATEPETRMTIMPDGSVGIGTTSPNNRIDAVEAQGTVANVLANGTYVAKFTGNTTYTTGASQGILIGGVDGSLRGVALVAEAQSALNDHNFIIAVSGTSATPTERVRIDALGNLLVGQSSTALPGAGTTTEGISISGQYDAIFVSRASGVALSANRNSDGDIQQFRKDGETVGSIGSVSDSVYIDGGSSNYSVMLASDFRPRTSNGVANNDAAVDLGDSSARWKDLYRSGSTISTSDRNMKQDERDLTVAEATVAQACKSLLKAFRFIDAVEKDGDGARIHFGIVAQDLQAAFEAEGLDATDYAMFRPSTYTDENGNEQTRLGVCYENLLAFIIAAI